MPFISNDIDFKVIDDEQFNAAGADYEDYVIARKLYVHTQTPFPENVSKVYFVF